MNFMIPINYTIAFELVLLLSLLQAEESELNEHHSEQLVAYMRYNLQPPNLDVHIQS